MMEMITTARNVDYKKAFLMKNPLQQYAISLKKQGPLMSAAMPLLMLIQQISTANAVQNVEQFHQQVVNAIRQFEHDAKLGGVPAISVLTARYAICATVDEMVLNTAWGQAINWHMRTMLAMFHEDTWGGEKFFKILQDLEAEPSMHIETLELMYFCLCLGFQGQYRLEAQGNQALEHIRQHLMFILNRFDHQRYERKPKKTNVAPKKPKKSQFWLRLAVIFVAVFSVCWLTLLLCDEVSLHQSLSVLKVSMEN